jgi:hypothetical protein
VKPATIERSGKPGDTIAVEGVRPSDTTQRTGSFDRNTATGESRWRCFC